MVLQRWDPIVNIRRFERTPDRFLRGFGVWGLPHGGGLVNGALPLDVEEDDGSPSFAREHARLVEREAGLR